VSEHSWRETVRLVTQRANGCCEYCQSCEEITGQPMHIDHIDPTNGDHLENLCLACANCNLSKLKAVSALDSATGEWVNLYNPRTQLWDDHFYWAEDGLKIIGKTPVGRATIERLRMNRERILTARTHWIKWGVHPPNRNQ
jgi:hypothetical protein